MHNWLVQNAAPPNGAPPGNNADDEEEIQVDADWGAWPAPQAPPMPPHLVNYQAWLAAQGLWVQDGIVPKNNITDSAEQAWNDSITISDKASADTEEPQIVPRCFTSS